MQRAHLPWNGAGTPLAQEVSGQGLDSAWDLSPWQMSSSNTPAPNSGTSTGGEPHRTSCSPGVSAVQVKGSRVRISEGRASPMLPLDLCSQPGGNRLSGRVLSWGGGVGGMGPSVREENYWEGE